MDLMGQMVLSLIIEGKETNQVHITLHVDDYHLIVITAEADVLVFFLSPMFYFVASIFENCSSNLHYDCYFTHSHFPYMCVHHGLKFILLTKFLSRDNELIIWGWGGGETSTGD